MRLTAQRILADHLRVDWFEGQPAADPPGTGFWPDMRLDLTGATLIDLNFYRVVAADARFAGATFAGTAQFYGAIFGGASFHGANFAEDAAFSRADYASASRTASSAAGRLASSSGEGTPATSGNDHHSGQPASNPPRRVARHGRRVPRASPALGGAAARPISRHRYLPL